MSEILKQDSFSTIYILLLFVPLVTNMAAKVYSTFLVNRLESDNPNRKFVVSLENAAFFSLVIWLQIYGSFLDRSFRLYFYYPLILMFCCVIFPLMIIVKNKKMKNELKNFMLGTLENLNIIKTNSSNFVAPF